MIEKLEMRNHKKEKRIVVLIMILSIIMIVLFSCFLYFDIKNRPLINYPKYTLSTTDWTGNDVIVTILNDKNISTYSFDGGNTYQTDNTFKVSSNDNIYIMVKDINGRNSKMIPISIQNIDKESPIITFETSTIIMTGSTFSLTNGVNVFDQGSGLNGHYVISPSQIDTSVPGEYVVVYTAFDKVGNYTEKKRTITVTDVHGTTYYRYRTSTVKPYQCNPYMCSCVVSDAAKLNGTCPTGYVLQGENQCCQTCYETCQETIWSEWSEWSTEKITPTGTREVETKIE